MSANPGGLQAATLVDELARAGVRHAVISPGSRSTPLALAFADDERVRVHVMIDERSAAFLALGIGKAVGGPAAVVSTSGSAAAHFHPAVIEADLSATPLLVLTADRPPELRGTGANQTIDQIKLFGSSVRWFAEVGVAENGLDQARYWRSTAARAWAEAVGVPPGPVHLNLPFREPLGPAGEMNHLGRRGGRPWTTVTRAPVAADDRALESLARRIDGIERGVIVAGGTQVAGDGVLALAERLRWPLLAEVTTGLRRGPRAISTYDALLRAREWAGAHRPDFVLRIGRANLSKSMGEWQAEHVPQVLVDPYGSWHDPQRTLSEIVVGDPDLSARRVAELLETRPETEWEAEWLSAERTARAALDAVLDRSNSPSEPRTARDVAGLLPDGAVLALASSMPVRDVDWFMAPRDGLRFVANRGASGIDGFVSTALGAALAHEGPACALAGDLSLFHDSNGLLLDPDGTADLTMVVVNNSGGRIFSFLPAEQFGRHFERLFATPHNRSIERLAGLHECDYSLLENASDLGDALAAARATGGVSMVEVRTEQEENRALHEELWAAVARALS